MSKAVFIPARLASTRFPSKPLADINGKPMIVHVLQRARESGIEDVYVACCEQEVADIVAANQGRAVMTDPDHMSGTDRIYEAYQKIGQDYDYIINLQGDLPSIDPKIITRAVKVLEDNEEVDIATLVCPIADDGEKNNPNIVKAVLAMYASDAGRALYFTRVAAPYGKGNAYHHIGLYVYRSASIKRFVGLQPSALEKQEKLEQLRALENNMRIDAAIVDSVPLGVDTKEDLEIVKKLLT